MAEAMRAGSVSSGAIDRASCATLGSSVGSWDNAKSVRASKSGALPSPRRSSAR